MTVAELLEAGGYTSTGQVYHHLRPLLAAGVVFEADNIGRGVYAITNHFAIRGIYTILSGILCLLDEEYGIKGEWGGNVSL